MTEASHTMPPTVNVTSWQIIASWPRLRTCSRRGGADLNFLLPMDRSTRRVAADVTSVHKACLQLALDLTAPHWNHVFTRVLPRVVPGWLNYEVDAAPARTDRDPSWPPPAHQMSTTDGSFVPLVRLRAMRPAIQSHDSFVRAHRRLRSRSRALALAIAPSLPPSFCACSSMARR